MTNAAPVFSNTNEPLPPFQLAQSSLYHTQLADKKYHDTAEEAQKAFVAVFAAGVPKFTPEQRHAVDALLSMQAAACVPGNISEHVRDALALVSEGQYQPSPDDFRRARPNSRSRLRSAIEKFRLVSWRLCAKHGLEY